MPHPLVVHAIVGGAWATPNLALSLLLLHDVLVLGGATGLGACTGGQRDPQFHTSHLGV